MMLSLFGGVHDKLLQFLGFALQILSESAFKPRKMWFIPKTIWMEFLPHTSLSERRFP